jgi:subtilisin family serine protease
MTSGKAIRQYVVLNRQDRENSIPQDLEGDDLLRFAQGILEKLIGHAGEYQVVSVPSHGWQFYKAKEKPLPSPASEAIISVTVPDRGAAELFRNAVAEANRTEAGKPEPFLSVGADLSASETEYFCPAGIDQMLFGDRAAAARLTRSRYLSRQGRQGLTGNGVNIVVIDQGFDRNQVKNFGGGWAQGGVVPGATRRGHGPMIVRNIWDAAPDSTFWDLPLIPLAIDNVDAFISTAIAAVGQVLQFIAKLQQPRPWILVNAWAIYDRASEYPIGQYTQNPNNFFNQLIGQAVDKGRDVIFAAGNCGQFCPSRQCGRLDVGPGYSIWGANSHPRVLTTGAVRTDARWLGNSSQGPGQPLLSLAKPDLCLPSNFRDEHDAFTGNTAEPYVGDRGTPFIANTGTSAACGLAAGIVAALRSAWGPMTVTPDFLIQRLNATARKTEGPLWNGRLGNGILDAQAAYDNLNALYPAWPYP